MFGSVFKELKKFDELFTVMNAAREAVAAGDAGDLGSIPATFKGYFFLA